MRILLRQKVTIISLLAVFLLTVSSAVISGVVFRKEISKLYLHDYAERIRNIEFEYGDVDAVTGASDEVGTVQKSVIKSLEEKYVRIEGLQAYPFIMNGDKNLIFHIDSDGSELSSEIAERIIETKKGDFEFMQGAKRYWTVFSYFDEWDWYTGYILPNSTRFSSLRSFLLVMNIASVIIAFFLWLLLHFFLRSQLKPLRILSDGTNRLSEGDLTIFIPVKRDDEIGAISSQFNTFIEQLKIIISGFKSAVGENSMLEEAVINSVQMSSSDIKEVLESTNTLISQMELFSSKVDVSKTSVDAISGDIRGLHALIKTHVDEVEKSSGEIMAMTRSLQTVAGITGKEIRQAQGLRETANQGGEDLRKTNEAIRAITAHVDDISGFVHMIHGIASQTNLLSMNAAIEAAHAGDAGRGFAVVADEIRKLANQAAENAKSIASVVKGILSTIGTAGEAGRSTSEGFALILSKIEAIVASLGTIEQQNRELEGGCVHIRDSMGQLGSAVSDIRQKADHTLNESMLINDALDELSRVSLEVTALISQISGNTSSSSDIINSIDLTAREMGESMGRLQKSIERFRTE